MKIINKIIKLLTMPILVTSGVASIIGFVVGFLTMDLLILLPSIFFLTLIYELICKVIIERTMLEWTKLPKMAKKFNRNDMRDKEC